MLADRNASEWGEVAEIRLRSGPKRVGATGLGRQWTADRGAVAARDGEGRGHKGENWAGVRQTFSPKGLDGPCFCGRMELG